MRFICLSSVPPGRSGACNSSSAKMQPTAHMSIGVAYEALPNRSSGQRYQSVTTRGVNFADESPNGRARPKSAAKRGDLQRKEPRHAAAGTCQLDFAFVCVEHIAHLQVAVQYPARVHEADSAQQLKHYAFYLCLAERLRHALHQPAQIVRAISAHERGEAPCMRACRRARRTRTPKRRFPAWSQQRRWQAARCSGAKCDTRPAALMRKHTADVGKSTRDQPVFLAAR